MSSLPDPTTALTARAAETREKLHRAALELFVAQGVTETTTRQIAAKAGIAEGTIYRHYQSKEALACDLLIDQHVKLANALRKAHEKETSLEGKIKALVHCYCALAEEDWLVFCYHLLYQYQFLSKITRPEGGNPADVIREIVVQAMEKGEAPNRDVDLVLGMALGVVMQSAIQMVYGRLQGQFSDYADEMAAAIQRVVTG